MRSKRQQAGMRYAIRFGIGMVLYSALVLTTPRFAKQAPAPWNYVLVLAPIVGVVIVAWALYMFISETDEYQRLRMLKALAFSVAFVCIVGFGYGMCETVGAPHLSMVWVPPLWAVGFGIGAIWRAVVDR